MNLVLRESRISPALSALDQLRIDTVAATADKQHLGEGHLGVVGEWNTDGNEGNVASKQGRHRVIADLDHQRTLENLESSSTRQSVSKGVVLGLATERDSREGVVGILSLLGSDQRLDDLVAVLGVQVLGAIVVGNEVRLSWGAQRVSSGVPLGVAGSSAVDKVASWLKAELGVDVKPLQ